MWNLKRWRRIRKRDCSLCGQPSKVTIHFDLETLEFVERRDWIRLFRCPKCGALWQSTPYEPYASWHYQVAWRWDVAFWQKAYDLDDGHTLALWHEATLVSLWDKLSQVDREWVEKHKRRAYGHTPYFRVYATDQQWHGYVLSSRSYFEKTFGAEQAEVWLQRRPPIPDLEKLVACAE